MRHTLFLLGETPELFIKMKIILKIIPLSLLAPFLIIHSLKILENPFLIPFQGEIIQVWKNWKENIPH